jgi:signal transduction histidine kinase
MRERITRILVAASIGAFIVVLNYRLDIEFARHAYRPESTVLNDLIIGFVCGLCAYAWASLIADRQLRRSVAEKLRQEGALQERSRIAREIHDTLAQGFAAMVINIEAAHEILDENSEAQKLCQRALRIGRESLVESRSLLQGLHPQGQTNKNLRATIILLLRRLTEGTSLQFGCSIDDVSKHISPETEREILLIVREALNNVVNHASAKEVRVTLRVDGRQIHLCVEDDGCGFVPGDPFLVLGFGLTSMRERAQNLGGLLWIYTQPGQGTQLVAFIPISEEAEAGSRPCEIPIPFESSSPTTIRSYAKGSEPS